jgi:zinc D-Ala-D-Ala carboxypeptidase
MKLSEHLALSEVTRSESAKRNGISNMPTPEHIENFKILAEKVFEPIRNHFGCPIHISSGYRSKALNAIVKGSSLKSDHCKGMALDLDQDGHSEGVTNNQVFHYIKDNLKFKQLIAEYPINGQAGWVHVSFDEHNIKNEVLICVKKNGDPDYLPYKGNEHLVH